MLTFVSSVMNLGKVIDAVSNKQRSSLVMQLVSKNWINNVVVAPSYCIAFHDGI